MKIIVNESHPKVWEISRRVQQLQDYFKVAQSHIQDGAVKLASNDVNDMVTKSESVINDLAILETALLHDTPDPQFVCVYDDILKTWAYYPLKGTG